MSAAEIARNMTQSPDNWPSRDVKAVAQSHGDLLKALQEIAAGEIAGLSSYEAYVLAIERVARARSVLKDTP